MADTHGGELAVDIRGLIKSFGHTRALDGLDLSVAAGSVTGFLGPNGAGKSTAIRVLLGLLRADRVHANATEPRRRAAIPAVRALGALRLLRRDLRAHEVKLYERGPATE